MKINSALIAFVALPWFGAHKLAGSANDLPGSPFEISLGSATFISPTNVPGVEVKGKSNALSGRVDINRDGNNLVIQNLEAAVPVKTFATGIKVRDEHLRKHIFTTADGGEPDLRFKAERTVCSGEQNGREYTCALDGELSIRAIAKPFRITLYMKDSAGTLQSLRAAGDAVVKLSDYGIDRPKQFGIQCKDEVKLHLELAGKQKSGESSDPGGSR